MASKSKTVLVQPIVRALVSSAALCEALNELTTGRPLISLIRLSTPLAVALTTSAPLLTPSPRPLPLPRLLPRYRPFSLLIALPSPSRTHSLYLHFFHPLTSHSLPTCSYRAEQNVIFKHLQQGTRVQLWLFDNLEQRLEGKILVRPTSCYSMA